MRVGEEGGEGGGGEGVGSAEEDVVRRTRDGIGRRGGCCGVASSDQT